MSEPRRIEVGVSRRPPFKIPRYRRALAGLRIVAGGSMAIAAMFAPQPAKENCWVTSFGLAIYGVVIRYQHVRL